MTDGMISASDSLALWPCSPVSLAAEAAMEAVEPGHRVAVPVTTGGQIAMGLPDGLAVGDPTGCGWTRNAEFVDDNVIDLVVNGADPAMAYLAAAVTVNGAFSALIAGTTDGVTWSDTGALLADTYPLTIETAPSRPQRLYLGAEDGNPSSGSSTSRTTAAPAGRRTRGPTA
jgi:hypothetical protein